MQKIFYKNEKYYSNLIFELNNIFDKKYEMPWQFQDPGFNAMVRMEFNF